MSTIGNRFCVNLMIFIQRHLLGMLLNPSPLFGISGICSLSPIRGYSTALCTHCCWWVFELPECCFANCCCSPATICITSGLPARAVGTSRGRRTRRIGGGILDPMEGPRKRILGGGVSSESYRHLISYLYPSPICVFQPTFVLLTNKRTCASYSERRKCCCQLRATKRNPTSQTDNCSTNNPVFLVHHHYWYLPMQCFHGPMPGLCL